jgi:hypothetical protein
MSSLSVSVKSLATKSDDSSTPTLYEGTVTLPGARPFKICRRSDNETKFASRSALSTAARSFAKSVGFTAVELVDPVSLKKAAKASATKTTKTTSKKTACTPCGDA